MSTTTSYFEMTCRFLFAYKTIPYSIDMLADSINVYTHRYSF